MSYCGYHLAMNPEIQKKLQEEIDEAYEKLGDEKSTLDYQCVMNLAYLDQVIMETLRMHPPLDLLSRNCVKDYKIPDSNIVIEKGDDIHINVIGIHHDPKHYPDPLKFNPENFNKENRAKRSPYVFYKSSFFR